MTETEQLKKQADAAGAREKLSELQQYINHLFDELEEARSARRRQAGMMTSAMSVWALSVIAAVSFGGPELAVIERIANMLFWAVLIREWIFILPHYFGIVAELDGCIKTLEILGMIEKGGGNRKQLKKYKESVIAKAWEALKTKRMREVFA